MIVPGKAEDLLEKLAHDKKKDGLILFYKYIFTVLSQLRIYLIFWKLIFPF